MIVRHLLQDPVHTTRALQRGHRTARHGVYECPPRLHLVQEEGGLAPPRRHLVARALARHHRGCCGHRFLLLLLLFFTPEKLRRRSWRLVVVVGRIAVGVDRDVEGVLRRVRHSRGPRMEWRRAGLAISGVLSRRLPVRRLLLARLTLTLHFSQARLLAGSPSAKAVDTTLALLLSLALRRSRDGQLRGFLRPARLRDSMRGGARQAWVADLEARVVEPELERSGVRLLFPLPNAFPREEHRQVVGAEAELDAHGILLDATRFERLARTLRHLFWHLPCWGQLLHASSSRRGRQRHRRRLSRGTQGCRRDHVSASLADVDLARSCGGIIALLARAPPGDKVRVKEAGLRLPGVVLFIKANP